MLIQIAIGTGLILLTVIIAGVGFLGMEAALSRRQPWLMRPPHGLKLLVLLVGAVLWILMIATAGVWLWAITLWALGIFVTIEAAVYFALVAFTTLGFGDILLPTQWRLLSGMAAINGLLMIGFQTAFLVETVRQIRTAQWKMHSGAGMPRPKEPDIQ